MTERHTDPLELWVGTWTPEEWIERENRKRGETPTQISAADSAAPDEKKPAE